MLIEANTRSYERAMARIEQKTDKAIRASSRSVQSLDASMKGAAMSARSLAGAFGAGVLAGGLSQLPGLFRGIVSEAAGLVDVAAKVGLTTDALQQLHYQAQQNGSSTQAMDAALEQFARRVGEAARGGGELAKIFEANGVALRDSSGAMRPVNDLLAEYANLIANAGSDTDRAVLAQQAFRDLDMGNVFRDGAAGMRSAAAEAESLGLVMRNGLLVSAAEVDDQFDRLSATISVNFKSAILEGMDAAAAFNTVLDNLGRSAAKVAGLSEARAKLGVRMGGGARGYNPSDFDWVQEMRGNPPALHGTVHPTVLPPSGGGGGGRDQAAAAAERERDAVKKLIEGLEFENSLIGQSAEAQRVLTELRKAGAAATDEQARMIVQLVQKSIAGEEAAKKLEEAQRAAIERMDAIRDAAKDAMGSFVHDLMDGVSAAEALGNMLDNIASKLADQAISSLIDAALGKSGSSGGLLGSLFGGARAGGGPVSAGKAYLVGERGPELFAPRTSGRIVPNGNGGHLQVVVNNNAPVRVTPQETADGRGGRRLEIQIDEAVASAITRQGSQAGRAIQNRFGARQQVVKR